MWTLKSIRIIAAAGLMSAAFSMPSQAQSDMSPVLLIETGPSDNPEYRRMTFTKFLRGNAVTVAYKSYNRSEFIQVRDTTPPEMINACSSGRSVGLGEIQAYEASERRAEQRGQKPEIKSFCVKNVPNWEGGNRKRWLDPIFNGMPYAKSLNN